LRIARELGDTVEHLFPLKQLRQGDG
jgi:hypothetical protein